MVANLDRQTLSRTTRGRTPRSLATLLLAAGCEVVALVHEARQAFTASRETALQRAARIETIDRLAYRLAVNARLSGDEPALMLACRIRQECGRHREDSAEDCHREGINLLEHIAQIARSLSVSVTQAVTGLRADERAGTVTPGGLAEMFGATEDGQ